MRDAARRAAIQIRAVAPRDAVLRISAGRERDETNSSQTAFQQSSLTEVWDEAERASFDALKALGTAKGQVQRELKEAEHLASMAESVVKLAQKELEGARQVVEELLLGGQQTSDGAAVARISDAILPGNGSGPQSVAHSTDSRPEDSVAFVQEEVSEFGIQEVSDDPHSEDDSPFALEDGLPEIVEGTAIQETPPEPAGQVGASASGGRDVGQSLFQKSSAIIGAIASMTRSDGARELPKDLFGEAAPDRSASQPPARKERSPKPVQRRGMPVAEAWAKRRVDPSAWEVEEVTEEALKRDLAELRQSLVDIRRSADKARAAGPFDQAPLTAAETDALKVPETAGSGGNGPHQGSKPEPSDPSATLEEDFSAAASPPDGGSDLDKRFQTLASLLADDLQGASPPAVEAPAPNEERPPSDGLIVQPQSRRGRPLQLDGAKLDAAPPVPDMGTLGDLPATYTGRLKVVFAPCPDSTMLGAFWQTMEAVVGAGKITTGQPLPGGAGYEFTLNLGHEVLIVEDLRSRIPQSELMATDRDTLTIWWAQS